VSGSGFDEAIQLIRKADSFQELVDDPSGRPAGSSAFGPAEDAYRKWAKIVHPDAVGAARSSAATEAFAKLSALFEGRDGTTVRAGTNTYRVGGIVAVGDIANLSAVDGRTALLKVPRSPADNDLMAVEAEALRTLHDKGDPRYRPYAPRLRDSFVHEDADRKRRTVNVLERLDGFVPLSRYRNVDPRDAAWMWRRLLVALGWAHRAGVVHGAVFEEHVLIHPAEHGLALVDWCYSGTRPTAIVAARRDAYPPEVLNDKRATEATDIYLATGLMTRLIGPHMPPLMRRFADGCRYDAPRMRPQDAWALLGEFDDLIGPREFRPFTRQPEA
jgi:serine/threonine protein kinase